MYNMLRFVLYTAYLLSVNGFNQNNLFLNYFNLKNKIKIKNQINTNNNQILNNNLIRDKYKNYNSKFVIHGGSLKTWSYKSHLVEQVQVQLWSEGRPIDSDIELWHGPGNTPCKMRVFIENGSVRPFNTVIETPRGPNTIAIKNIGQIEFPIMANICVNNVVNPSSECMESFATIQGGALRTYPLTSNVENAEIMLQTGGRPLNARIELIQGPNNNKQVVELYSEDGADRPFFCILETPGPGNVVRVLNTAPIEFPLLASVVPYIINNEVSFEPIYNSDVSLNGELNY